MPTYYSLYIFFDILIFIVLYFTSTSNLRYNKRSTNFVIIFGILLFCLFSFWGTDYFHYKEIFNNYKQFNAQSNLEPIYFIFCDIAPSYFFFRLLVWGIAVYLLNKTLHRLQITRSIFLYLFICFFLLRFSYARVSLAMVILFWGYSYLIKPIAKVPTMSRILGIILIMLSCFFHKSIVMAVVLFPFTFIKLTKFRIGILVILFPILAYIVDNYLFVYVLTSGYLKEDSIEMSAFLNYSQMDQAQRGIGAKLAFILELFPLYAIVLYLIYKQIVHKQTLNNEYSRLLTYAFAILYCSSLFAFIKIGSDVFYYRYMYMMYIPLILYIASYLCKYGRTKILTIICAIAVLAQLYQLLYSLYISTLA